ncbi:cell division protein SepF [Feifania hominis]|uniref:Cell division protein SepF n=1 Tax=Feifania hominis TaxID=2763660 RepID=A0A926DET8_9FIRM|nr:cell division protein SepF [Feifania hominis]MBC8536818.1 cell division protein SepF [Feifania hominis]
MGMFSKLKDFIGAGDDDLYDEEEEDVGIFAIEKGVSGDGRERAPEEKKGSSYETRYESKSAEQKRSNKVVNIHTTAQLQVILVKPERFDDAAGIADHLNEKRTIVLNLESTNKDVSRRLVDFLSGVAYANGGQIKKVANSTFIITPYNVDIMGDLLDELENNGVFF